RVDERLLHGVLGARGRQQPRAVAQEWPPIPLYDRLERAVVALAGQVDQPLVRLRSQQRHARVARWLYQLARGHVTASRGCYVLNTRAVRTSRGGTHAVAAARGFALLRQVE